MLGSCAFIIPVRQCDKLGEMNSNAKYLNKSEKEWKKSPQELCKFNI